MLKRILVILLICSTVMCSTACGNTPYDIIEKGGKHYLSFNSIVQDKQVEIDEFYASKVASHSFYFTNIGQMKTRIKNCDFNDQEFAAIQYNCGDDGLWEICDLNNLCDVRTPQGVGVEGVRWYGDSYCFELACQLASCSVNCMDMEAYKKTFEEYYANCPYSFPLAREFWVEKISDRNATQIFYQTDGGDFKIVKYEIHEKSRTLYVEEDYCLTSYDGILEVSDTVPDTVRVFTEENDACLYIRISELAERPSVEWLSSFGVTPYEGE